MNRPLVYLILPLLILSSSHFLVINYCHNCLKLEQSQRILLNYQFIHSFHQLKASWKPYHSHNLSKNIPMSIHKNGDLSTIQEIEMDGIKQTVIVEREYISISGRAIKESDITTHLSGTLTGCKVIVNNTREQLQTLTSRNTSNIFYVSEIDQPSLDKLIRETVEASDEKQQKKVEDRIIKARERIFKMQESQSKIQLINLYSIVLNYQGRKEFNTLLGDLESKLGQQGQQIPQASHWLSIITVTGTILSYVIYRSIHRAQQQRLSPI